MLKNIKDLSDLININNPKDSIGDIVFDVLKIIKEESGLILKEKDFILKKNIFKIKSNSNSRFVIFLHIKNINQKIQNLNKNFILEL